MVVCYGLGAPLDLIGEKGVRIEGLTPGRITSRRHVVAKRSASSFDLSVGSPTYIDAIGIPRGVPDEYKLADQVAAGFENSYHFSFLSSNSK